MSLLHKKNQHGNTYKKSSLISVLLVCLLINFFAQTAGAYQTALITYPDNNKNWKQIYFGKQYDETISQWIPSYSDSKNWSESVVFHAYNWAKGNSCYKFMMNLLANVESQNNTMKRQILKDSGVDSIAIWCVNKNAAMPAQCEILRVTSGYEGLISIHYINKNPQYFMAYQKDPWLKIIRDVRIYYSYFRWDRVTGKETSIQLQ